MKNILKNALGLICVLMLVRAYSVVCIEHDAFATEGVSEEISFSFEDTTPAQEEAAQESTPAEETPAQESTPVEETPAVEPTVEPTPVVEPTVESETPAPQNNEQEEVVAPSSNNDNNNESTDNNTSNDVQPVVDNTPAQTPVAETPVVASSENAIADVDEEETEAAVVETSNVSSSSQNLSIANLSYSYGILTLADTTESAEEETEAEINTESAVLAAARGFDSSTMLIALLLVLICAGLFYFLFLLFSDKYELVVRSNKENEDGKKESKVRKYDAYKNIKDVLYDVLAFDKKGWRDGDIAIKVVRKKDNCVIYFLSKDHEQEGITFDENGEPNANDKELDALENILGLIIDEEVASTIMA